MLKRQKDFEVESANETRLGMNEGVVVSGRSEEVSPSAKVSGMSA